MGLVLCIVMLFGATCRGEWDVPQTAKTDPCTGVVQNKYFYVPSPCLKPEMLYPQKK